MTNELVETQRLALSEDDRQTLAQHISALNDHKARYGQHWLPTNQTRRQLEAVKARLEAELKQRDEESATIEADIQQATQQLQTFSQALMERYAVNVNDGSTWSLNVLEGCFIQHKQQEATTVSKTPAKKRRGRPKGSKNKKTPTKKAARKTPKKAARKTATKKRSTRKTAKK